MRKFGPPQIDATRISIPLLVGFLRNSGKNAEKKQIEETFLDFCGTLVLTGDVVDKTENEILYVCKSISRADIRECSYANVLYKEVRSGYAHEYQPGGRADSFPMSRAAGAGVSYGNWAKDPDRHIYFHPNRLASLAIAAAEAIDKVAGTIPRNNPSRWWIDG